jgi:hypothetical protein
MMKFVDGDQAIIKSLDAKSFEREPKRRVSANQKLIVRGQELAERFDLAAIRTG